MTTATERIHRQAHQALMATRKRLDHAFGGRSTGASPKTWPKPKPKQ